MGAFTALTKKILPIPASDTGYTSDPSNISGRPLWQKFIFIGVFLIVLGIFFFVLTEPLAYPKHVSVSNVSANSITLSWTTAVPTPTKVLLLEANIFQYLPFFYYATSGDDRDKAGEFDAKRNIHYVTLKNLKPGSRYIAKIYNGVRQVHEQKLTTGPQLILPDPDLVYGKILNADKTPAAGALVYLRLVSKEGSSSALLSALTDSKGSWSIETSNARIRNLKKSFDARGVRSESLVVDDGRGKRFSAGTSPKEDKPWPTVVLTSSSSGKVQK